MEKQIIVVLVLCAGGILNANAAPTTTPSLVGLQEIGTPQNKTVFKYFIQVSVESGQTRLEKLEINTKAKTELISVQKYGDGEEIEVLQDYSKNLSVMHIKAKCICYLSKMKSAVLPDEFKADLEHQIIVEDNDTNIKVQSTTWKVDAVFTQRSLLSEEMAVMCARSSIYWIQRIHGTGSNRQSRDTGHPRVRRSPCMTNQICIAVCQLRIVIINGRKQLRCFWVLRCSNIVSC